MTGIEIQSALFQTALKNRQINDCRNIEFIEGDVKTEGEALKRNGFNVIVANPPYTKMGSGRKNPDDSRYIARHETALDLPVLLSMASSILPRKGRLYVIYPVKRLGELIYNAKAHRLEPKRLRFIQPGREEKPNLFLGEFLKDGGAGTSVEKPLCIFENSDYTEEVKSYYSLKD